MKKTLISLLTLIIAFGLSGCAERLVIDDVGSGNASSESSVVFPVVDDDGFKHTLFEGDNTVEHELQGYCGNTITKISRDTRMGGKPWEISFWGEDSVALTSLLQFLNYSGEVCKCLPEYNIETEFDNGKGYEVSLKEGYARYDGGQVSLTEEQVELIRDIINKRAD